MTYTIKAAADALGVTKNTLKYRLKKMPEEYISKGADGVMQISEDGFKWLKETSLKSVVESAEPIEEPTRTDSNQQEPGENEPDAVAVVVDSLTKTIELLQNQLAVKDQQIAALTDALKMAQQTANQAQALHAHQLQLTPEAGEPVQDPAQPAGEPVQPIETKEEPKRKHWWQWTKK